MAMRNAIIIKDDAFNPDIWEDGLYTFHISADRAHDPNAIYFTTQVDTGGNPGAYRSTIHQWGNQEGLKHSDISVFHLNRNAIVDPQRCGGIDKIDVSYDLRNVDPTFDGIEIMYAILVKQDGNLFIGANRTIKSTNWTSFHIPSLQAKDFARIHVLNPPPVAQTPQQKAMRHPDFSATGKPIQFGYTTMNTTNARQMESISGIDNWTVVVHGNLPTAQQPQQHQPIASGSTSGHSNQNQNYTQLTNELLDKVHQLEEQLRKEKTDRESLVKELADVSQQSVRQVADTKARHAYTEAALTEKSAQLTAAELEIIQLRQSLTEATHNESISQQKYAATVTELNMVRSGLDTTRKILEEEKSRYQAMVTDLEQQVVGLQQQLTTLTTQYQQERAERTRATQTSDSLNREIENLKQQLSTQTNEAAELKARVLDMERDYTEKIASMKAQHTKQIEELNAQHADQLKEKDAAHVSQTTELEAKYQAAISSGSEQGEVVADLQSKLKEHEARVSKLKEHINQLTETNTALQQQVTESAQEKHELDKKYKELECQNITAEELLAAAKKQLEEQALSAHERFSALEEAFNAERQRYVDALAEATAKLELQSKRTSQVPTRENVQQKPTAADDVECSVRVSHQPSSLNIVMQENYVGGQLANTHEDDFEEVSATASMIIKHPSPASVATTSTPAVATGESPNTSEQNQTDEWEILTDALVVTGSAAAPELNAQDEI